MPQGRWFLIADVSESTKIKTHWMDEADLERFKIEGKPGDEYLPFDDDPESKCCIVGEIVGRPAALLNSIVDTMDVLGADSQELRFNIIDDLVQNVARATMSRVLP